MADFQGHVVDEPRKVGRRVPMSSRTPERQKLADAIAKGNSAVRHLNALRDAHRRADEQTVAVFGAVDETAAKLREAQADESRRLADAFVGGGSGADVLAPEAEALNSAKRDLDRLRRTRDALATQVRDAEHAAEGAARRVAEAIRAVVSSDPAVEELLAEHERRRRAFEATYVALALLQHDASLPCARDNWRLEREPDLTGAADWVEALKALETDADAPLPAVG